MPEFRTVLVNLLVVGEVCSIADSGSRGARTDVQGGLGGPISIAATATVVVVGAHL